MLVHVGIMDKPRAGTCAPRWHGLAWHVMAEIRPTKYPSLAVREHSSRPLPEPATSPTLVGLPEPLALCRVLPSVPRASSGGAFVCNQATAAGWANLPFLAGGSPSATPSALRGWHHAAAHVTRLQLCLVTSEPSYRQTELALAAVSPAVLRRHKPPCHSARHNG